MNLPVIDSLYWKIGSYVAIFALGWYVCSVFDDAARAKAKAADQAAIINTQTNVIASERKAGSAINEVSNAYEKNIAAINGRADAVVIGLRPLPGNPNDLPAITITASEHNAAACANGLSQPRKEYLVKLLKQADLQTAQLMACQKLVEAYQGMYQDWEKRR